MIVLRLSSVRIRQFGRLVESGVGVFVFLFFVLKDGDEVEKVVNVDVISVVFAVLGWETH